jgi:hypothetical protein
MRPNRETRKYSAYSALLGYVCSRSFTGFHWPIIGPFVIHPVGSALTIPGGCSPEARAPIDDLGNPTLNPQT